MDKLTMKGLKGLGKRQREIIDYMRKGFRIVETHDNYTNEHWIELSDESDTIMDVPKSTVESFVNRGIVKLFTFSPSLQIDQTIIELKRNNHEQHH